MKVKNVQLKLNEEFNFESIDFNALTVLIGANGTGKSLILKMNYLMTLITNTLSMGLELEVKPEIMQQTLQFLLDSVFSDFDYTGHCKVTYGLESSKNDVVVAIYFEKGRILEYTSTNLNEWKRTHPLYMSPEARLFGYLDMILQIIMQEHWMDNPDNLKELILSQKHYNISYALCWKDSCPFKVPASIRKELSDRFDFKDSEIPYLIDIDPDKKKVFGLFGESKTKKFLTSFGAGHQAMLNMLITVNLISNQP